MSDEVRRARNQALRNLADPLSGPRDTAVTLAAFENVYHDGLNGNPHPRAKPSWATQLHQSLSEKAHTLVPAGLDDPEGGINVRLDRPVKLLRGDIKNRVMRLLPAGVTHQNIQTV
jgi:hypothetical protein